MWHFKFYSLFLLLNTRSDLGLIRDKAGAASCQSQKLQEQSIPIPPRKQQDKKILRKEIKKKKKEITIRGAPTSKVPTSEGFRIIAPKPKSGVPELAYDPPNCWGPSLRQSPPPLLGGPPPPPPSPQCSKTDPAGFISSPTGHTFFISPLDRTKTTHPPALVLFRPPPYSTFIFNIRRSRLEYREDSSQ